MSLKSVLKRCAGNLNVAQSSKKTMQSVCTSCDRASSMMTTFRLQDFSRERGLFRTVRSDVCSKTFRGSFFGLDWIDRRVGNTLLLPVLPRYLAQCQMTPLRPFTTFTIRKTADIKCLSQCMSPICHFVIVGFIRTSARGVPPPWLSDSSTYTALWIHALSS